METENAAYRAIGINTFCNYVLFVGGIIILLFGHDNTEGYLAIIGIILVVHLTAIMAWFIEIGNKLRILDIENCIISKDVSRRMWLNIMPCVICIMIIFNFFSNVKDVIFYMFISTLITETIFVISFIKCCKKYKDISNDEELISLKEVISKM
jgi:hypothetical protein